MGPPTTRSFSKSLLCLPTHSLKSSHIAFDDFTLVDLIVQKGSEAFKSLPRNIQQSKEAMAETIENNVRRLIIDETPTNPKYYENMSVLLDELIKDRKAETKDYEEYLSKIVELSKKVRNPADSSSYPECLISNSTRALYDNLGKNTKLALDIHDEIIYTKKDGWRENIFKQREVRNAIRKHISDEEEVNQIFELVKNQNEY